MYKKKSTKKNKPNKPNKRKNKKTTQTYKTYKKGGNTIPKNNSLENPIFSNNLEILANQRLLNRIRDTIQYCNDLIQHLKIEQEILWQEKFELSENYLSDRNDELYKEIHKVYQKIEETQNELIKILNYQEQFVTIYDILSNTGEELTPAIRQRYIDEYNDLTLELYQLYNKE